eukprot:COSAG02_NODE_44773_length_363_cov_0.693182_1_plen_48_part_10
MVDGAQQVHHRLMLLSKSNLRAYSVRFTPSIQIGEYYSSVLALSARSL